MSFSGFVGPRGRGRGARDLPRRDKDESLEVVGSPEDHPGDGLREDQASVVTQKRRRFPLLIRLEVHLTPEWQRKAVQLLLQILGSKLYRPAEDPAEKVAGDNQRRPSPHDFQMKILLVVRSFFEGECQGSKLPAGTEEGELSEEDESYENSNCSSSKAKKSRKMLIVKVSILKRRRPLRSCQTSSRSFYSRSL